MDRVERRAARRARRRRHRIGAGALAVVAVIGLGGGVAVAMTGRSGPSYRLAAVENGTVSQTLTSVGTISPVNHATVSFPIGGTVRAVNVTVGQTVTAGQSLASLDANALEQQVSSDAAAVAAAQQALAADEASQIATASPASATSASSLGAGSAASSGVTADTMPARSLTGTGPGARTVSPAPVAATGATSAAPDGARRSGIGVARTAALTGLTAAVTRAEQDLVKAQRMVDDDLTAAEQALQTCKDDLSIGGQAPPPSPTSGASTTAPTTAPTTGRRPGGGRTTPASPSATSASTAPGNSAADKQPPAPAAAGCLAAIEAAPSERQSALDMASVATAEATLTSAVGKLISGTNGASTGGAAGGSTGSGVSRTGTNASSGASSSGASSSTTRNPGGPGTGAAAGATGGGARSAGPATAAQLAADQARVDAATATLAVARENVGNALLSTPIAGTVAAVGLTPGDAVVASSSTSTITIIGPGQTQVATTVPLASIASVKVGQRARVTVDGSVTPITGTVTSIGLLASTTGTTTTYPVTVLLDPTVTRLVDGAGASVTIGIAVVSNVLTVPSSAVHVAGSAGTVTVLKNGATTVTRVTLGAVGIDRTQITSGLVAGQHVVLARLDTTLPTSTTNSNVTRRLGVTTNGGALTTGGGLTGTGTGGTRVGGR